MVLTKLQWILGFIVFSRAQPEELVLTLKCSPRSDESYKNTYDSNYFAEFGKNCLLIGGVHINRDTRTCAQLCS